MKKRILVLGAGFGGLELTTLLSESLGDSVETTLIDRNDAFVFGFPSWTSCWVRIPPSPQVIIVNQ